MATIEYIGKKDVKPDNVANTGLVWNGPGDRQEVSDPVAVAKLLEYPDIWKVVGGEEAIEKSLKDAVEATANDATKPKGKYDPDETEDAAVRVDVNRLNKVSLVAYTKRTFGVDLDSQKTVAELRETVARMVAKDGAITRNVRGGPKAVAAARRPAKKK